MTAEEFFKEHYKHPEIQMVSKESAIRFAESYLKHSQKSFKKEIIDKLESMQNFGHVHFKSEYSDFANGLFENIRRHIDDIGDSHGLT